jgi:tetratricopeptide (TPR) repeat protein
VIGDERALETLERARDAFLGAGRPDRAAEAETLLAELWWHRGDRDRADAHLARSRALVADLPSSPAKAHVLSQSARYSVLAGDHDAALRVGQEALAVAEALGLAELHAHALTNVGSAKGLQGDADGLVDLERSAEIALTARSPEAARAMNNLAAVLMGMGDVRRAVECFAEATRIADELGAVPIGRFTRAQILGPLMLIGSWDEVVLRASEQLAEIETGQPSYAEVNLRHVRAWIQFARGDTEFALAETERVLAFGRQVKDPQVLIPVLARAARVYGESGRDEEARLLVRELLEALEGKAEWRFVEGVWVVERLGYAEELRSHVERQPRTRWRTALLASLDGELESAADQFHQIGALPYEATTRQQAAEKLAAAGRPAEADAQLQLALAFWRSVGAVRYIREGEALLARTA